MSDDIDADMKTTPALFEGYGFCSECFVLCLMARKTVFQEAIARRIEKVITFLYDSYRAFGLDTRGYHGSHCRLSSDLLIGFMGYQKKSTSCFSS